MSYTPPEAGSSQNQRKKRQHSAQDWENQRPHITRLYSAENKSLVEVIATMKVEHGFEATYAKSIYPFLLNQILIYTLVNDSLRGGSRIGVSTRTSKIAKRDTWHKNRRHDKFSKIKTPDFV